LERLSLRRIAIRRQVSGAVPVLDHAVAADVMAAVAAELRADFTWVQAWVRSGR
jgi:hypothetical protein